MKKLFLLILLGSSFNGMAQVDQSVDYYLFKAESGKAYTPLTTGINITAGKLWQSENFKIPIGFTAKIGDKIITDLSLHKGPMGVGSDTSGIVHSFTTFGGTALMDRGAIDKIPKSPLRYLVSGISPNRIFKFEAFNVGFYINLNDSVNFQVWLYETSNIVEIRFGESKISRPTDYFYKGKAPILGFNKDVDLDNDTNGKIYFLKDSPTAPTVDSGKTLVDITTISDYPTSGTVYRFIPKTVAASIGESTIATKFQVYPTITIDNITVMADKVAVTSARIIDLNGKVVGNIQNIENGKNSIDVSSFASGNYLLEITNAEGKAVYKFTKQ